MHLQLLCVLNQRVAENSATFCQRACALHSRTDESTGAGEPDLPISLLQLRRSAKLVPLFHMTHVGAVTDARFPIELAFSHAPEPDDSCVSISH